MKDITVAFSAGLVLVMAIIGAMHILRRKYPTTLTEQQQNTMIGPFSFIATLYAFLLGFIVVNLWQSFKEARHTTTKEAETIVVLDRLAEGFPASRSFQTALFEYVKSIRENEWPAMADGETSKKTEAIYERLWAEGRTLAPRSPTEQALYAKIIDELSALSVHRRDRIILNQLGLPSVLWGTLFAGGFLLLVGLYFLSISGTWVQIVVDIMVIGMMLLMIWLAIEFSAPFQGYVKVSPLAFENVEATMSRLH